MKAACRFLIVLTFLLCASFVGAQELNSKQVGELLEKEGCVALAAGRVKVCKYDYSSDGLSMEAISFRPVSGGPFPALMLIPGYARTARDYIPLGIMFAGEGYASVAITQPGFGKSQGKPDYVGPATLKALTAGWKKFKQEPFVDAKRMGIYGHSRGGMAASLLSVRLDDVRAAILSAGIYDFKKAYDEATIQGIRENMKSETGITDEAVRERSSILQMANLKCPVLILHGDKDENVSVEQALLLRDRLTALKKEFEIKIFIGQDHALRSGSTAKEVNTTMMDFLKRRLAGVSSN
ncbi:MAG TPA: prolyl oligopeptidase family serine peptidase [Pyrinomonadaceae bacterium]|jgi:dipeptidyl aminopeptidase/acylaminoacyl peptidase|nr:prolyl oligopeptidase family serine peptidase [Pyrinomonadaceae bacterium]